MNMTPDNDRISGLKAQAKRLRARLKDNGTEISHSQSLELLAEQHGARDWNTLRAMAAQPENPRPFRVGDRVTGQYLGQRFFGYVQGLSHSEHAKHHRITLHFDDPVDVVTFESFSSFRQRVSGVIDEVGRSPRKTSNGVPQLIVQHAGA